MFGAKTKNSRRIDIDGYFKTVDIALVSDNVEIYQGDKFYIVTTNPYLIARNSGGYVRIESKERTCMTKTCIFIPRIYNAEAIRVYVHEGNVKFYDTGFYNLNCKLSKGDISGSFTVQNLADLYTVTGNITSSILAKNNLRARTTNGNIKIDLLSNYTASHYDLLTGKGKILFNTDSEVTAKDKLSYNPKGYGENENHVIVSCAESGDITVTTANYRSRVAGKKKKK